MATHLAELRDPLLGRDPQFGKRWSMSSMVYYVIYAIYVIYGMLCYLCYLCHLWYVMLSMLSLSICLSECYHSLLCHVKDIRTSHSLTKIINCSSGCLIIVLKSFWIPCVCSRFRKCTVPSGCWVRAREVTFSWGQPRTQCYRDRSILNSVLLYRWKIL